MGIRTPLALTGLILGLSAFATEVGDSFQWLETPRDSAALKWATEQTSATRSALSEKPVYAKVAAELKDVLGANAPPPEYTLLGDKAIRFRREAAHPHGVLEVAERGADGVPGEWKLALDVDALRAAEAKPYELHLVENGKAAYVLACRPSIAVS